MELVVVTLAFAFLNIITYVFWWNNPQRMYVPIMVRKGDEVKLRQVWLQQVEEEREAEDADESQRKNLQPAADETQSSSPRPVTVEEILGIEDVESQRERWNLRYRQMLEKLSREFRQLPITLEILCLVFIPVLTSAAIGFLAFAIIGIFVLSIPAIPASIIILYLLFMVFNDPSRSVLYSSQDALKSCLTLVTSCIISVAFGAIHLIPLWRTTYFPSSVENLLWRICSISITAMESLRLFGMHSPVSRPQGLDY